MKKIWAAYKLEVMGVHHYTICALVSLMDSTYELVYLNNDVFTSLKLQAITKET
jgi:hypothetical protein